MTKTKFTIVGITVLLVCIALFLIARTENEIQYGIEPTATPEAVDISNLIRLEEPVSGDLISSPVFVRGEAVGYWFFEASFPIKIYDGDGNEIGVGIAQAKKDWMTEDFVPFEASIIFDKPSTKAGKLVLFRDNPSDLRENDASLEVDVTFESNEGSISNGNDGGAISKNNCVVAGCSSQLCLEESEKDTITTCEWKEEYACFKTAECKRQDDGKCGWTPTEKLVSCLAEAFQAEANQ